MRRKLKTAWDTYQNIRDVLDAVALPLAPVGGIGAVGAVSILTTTLPPWAIMTTVTVVSAIMTALTAEVITYRPRKAQRRQPHFPVGTQAVAAPTAGGATTLAATLVDVSG